MKGGMMSEQFTKMELKELIKAMEYLMLRETENVYTIDKFNILRNKFKRMLKELEDV